VKAQIGGKKKSIVLDQKSKFAFMQMSESLSEVIYVGDTSYMFLTFPPTCSPLASLLHASASLLAAQIIHGLMVLSLSQARAMHTTYKAIRSKSYLKITTYLFFPRFVHLTTCILLILDALLHSRKGSFSLDRGILKLIT